MKILRKYINEKFTEGGDPVKDMGIGRDHWYEKVRDILFKNSFEDNDGVELFMNMAEDRLEGFYQQGKSEKEAVDILMDDKELLDMWEKQYNRSQTQGFPGDDLKANCRSLQGLGDKESAEELVSYLIDRYPDEDEDELRQMAYDWVEYEPSEDVDESYVMKSLQEGCNCSGKNHPRPKISSIKRPSPRPIPRILRPTHLTRPGASKMHEKFTEDSDPIRDLGIGTITVKLHPHFNTNNKKITSEKLMVPTTYTTIDFKKYLQKNHITYKIIKDSTNEEWPSVYFTGTKSSLINMIKDIFQASNDTINDIFSHNIITFSESKNNKNTMKKLNEQKESKDFYDIRHICAIALGNASAWIDHQDYTYFDNEMKLMKKKETPVEEIKGFIYDFIDTHIDKFFDIFTTHTKIEREYLDDHRDEIIDTIVSFTVSGEEKPDKDDVSQIIKRAEAKKLAPKVYAKMSQGELQHEVNIALDKKDYETLKKIQPYLKESLKNVVTKFLNENKDEYWYYSDSKDKDLNALIDNICTLAVQNKDKWIDSQIRKQYLDEMTKREKQGVSFEEEMKFRHDFIDSQIYRFYNMFNKFIDENLWNEHRDKIVDVLSTADLKKLIKDRDERGFKLNVEEENDVDTIRRQSEAKKLAPKDYSKMDQFDLKKEIDIALDKKDYETLKKIQPYLKEGFLKNHVDEILNEEYLMTPLVEKFKEGTDPIHDMRIGMINVEMDTCVDVKNGKIDPNGQNEEKFFINYLKKHNITYEVLNPNGIWSGGSWPIIAYNGTKKDIIRMLEDQFEVDDEEDLAIILGI